MNLFYDQSVIGLRQLIDTADKSLIVHNLVIDYDGEVIIDPEKKYTGVGLKRYMFHTRIAKTIKNAHGLKQLLETLVAAYTDHEGFSNLKVAA